MTQLWAWEYEGKTEFGWKHWERTSVSLYVAQDSSVSPIRDISEVTNLRKVKVVDEDVATKTYLTTKQFIKVWKSLDEPKQKELHAALNAPRDDARSAAWDAPRDAAWSAAWYAAWDADWEASRYAAWDAASNAPRDDARYAAWDAAWDADLAILVKDKISDEHFEILTKPWTSCGLSLYAEDWDEDVYDPTPPITKTYLTTEQFIKVWQSLNDEKRKELNADWDAAWHAIGDADWDADWVTVRDADWDADWVTAWNTVRNAARGADLAILVKDKISDEHFEILTKPWTSCGLSLYAEDWDEVLNPKVAEPKNFGAIVEAETPRRTNRRKFVKLVGDDNATWFDEEQKNYFVWPYLVNPIIISEGVE